MVAICSEKIFMVSCVLLTLFTIIMALNSNLDERAIYEIYNKY